MYNFTLKYRNSNETNLLDPLSVIDKVRLTGNTGVTSTDNNYFTTDYMPVTDGNYEVHRGTGMTATDVTFFDDKKNRTGGITNVDYSTFSIGGGTAKFVKISFHRTDLTVSKETAGMSFNTGSAYAIYYISKKVTPIYKKLTRGYDLQSQQQYYREKLDGTLSLHRKDYDYVDALPFDKQLLLLVSDTEGVLNDYVGYFYKTDCKWDADDRKVQIKTKPYDHYQKIESGLQKRFNLIEQAPELQEIQLRRRPVIQVYIAGDNTITNILGGTQWEQEIQTDPIFDHNALTSTYKFYNTENIRVLPASYASSLSTDVTGEYDDNRLNLNGLYRLEHVQTGGMYWRGSYYQIVRVSDNVVLYKTPNTDWNNTSVNTLLFTGINGETGSFYFTEYRIYTRYYTDLLEIERTGQSPVSTYPVPSEDIVANNSNYKQVVGYNLGTDKFAIYDQFVDTPTKFGRVPDGAPDAGKYYKEFLVSVVTGLSNPLPVSSSNWRAVSLWFFNDINIRYTEFIDGQDFTLRDAFPLNSVIQKLLEAVGSNLSFSNDTEHSEFLYSTTNPLGSFPYLDFNGGSISTAYSGNLTYFITPKSNIISANYDQPAARAEVTLDQVFKVLRDTLKLYWHVENGKLRMEHISWYQRGGTYGSNLIGTDITALVNPRNGKKWNFNQNKWEFDKEQMPERFEYGWMDDVTAPFQGHPIQIISNYVQEGRVEDLRVNGFTTDIDFVQSNPQEVSKDGFCLISTVMHEGKYKVPFISANLGYNSEVVMQNGWLSWLALHNKYHVYDLPADRANINGTDVTLYQNNTRQKKQEVSFPAKGFTIDPYKLVKTGLGNGIVDKLKIDMQSYIVKATIKHDTD